jgi:alpha-tubulin suppressor-like RCC1 family protein
MSSRRLFCGCSDVSLLARQLMRALMSVLAGALMLAALGCREDTEAPTAPESGQALATSSTAPLAFRQVSAGGEHTCGVTTDDRAYCWGRNFSGELGDGTTTDHSTPVAVTGGLRFRQVSAGGAHTCGLTTDDRAYCWGAGGLLGDGTTTPRLNPVAVAGGRRFRQVSAGSSHSCAVTPFDRAFCWGFNPSGQLGDGTTSRRLTPVRVQGAGLLFRQVSAGEHYLRRGHRQSGLLLGRERRRPAW